MFELPDSLLSLSCATAHERDDRYVVEILSQEVAHGTLSVGETYRVALLDAATAAGVTGQDGQQSSPPRRETYERHSEPPVEEDEVREVTRDTRRPR